MKKTKKALLAAIACSAALAGAIGLAACNGGNGDGESGHSHHYTYTSNDNGTHNGTCDADGDCDAKNVSNQTCDTTGTDGACSKCGYTAQSSQHTHSYTYTTNNDGTHNGTCANTDGECDALTVTSETCDTTGTDGACSKCGYTAQSSQHTHSYTYTTNNDGTHNGTCANTDGECDALTVTSETCDTDGEDGACFKCGYKAHVHVWSDWTVEEGNEPTEEAKGKATRTCSGEGDCDATTADTEYELPMLNETDYMVISTGEATCVENGRFTYVFVDVDDEISVDFLVTTPADPNAHELSERAGKAATCGEAGQTAYYSCFICGKTYKDADGQEEFEDLAELVIEPTGDHNLVEVAAGASNKTVKNPNNADVVYNSIAHHKCNTCGKTFKDAEGENEITALHAVSPRGMILGVGKNVVDATGVTQAYRQGKYLASLVADRSAKYTVTFSEDVTSFTNIGLWELGQANPTGTYSNGSWTTTSAVYGRFDAEKSIPTVANTLTVNLEKGEWVCFVLDVAAYTVDITVDPVLKFGENTVEITEAYAAFVDAYRFVPTETKTYSMTVPDGMEVLMNDEDFIVGNDRTVNFEATEGETIEFAFKHTKVGLFSVTIGEAVETPKLSTQAPVTVSMKGQTAIAVELGEDIVAGKKYKITFSGGFVTLRIQGAGYWWFKINGEASYDAMNNNTATGFQAAFTTTTGETVGEEKTWEYLKSRNELSVTFTAEEGDIIYLAIQDNSVLEGSPVADLVLTVTEVTE